MSLKDVIANEDIILGILSAVGWLVGSTCAGHPWAYTLFGTLLMGCAVTGTRVLIRSIAYCLSRR